MYYQGINKRQMVYNYIFVCSGVHHLDKDGYYAICAKDLEKCDNVHLVYDIVDRVPKFLRYLYELHTSRSLNRLVKLPFQDIWIPYYFKSPFRDDKPLCIVFQNWTLPLKAFKYYDKIYPGVKKVKLHRDLLKYAKDLEKYDEVFDFSMTIDNLEAEKYGYVWFHEYESKLDDLKIAKDYPECDVYFAGAAKGRLPKLMTIYHKLSDAGLKVHYYLVGVPQNERIPYEGITYADKGIPYREMLYHTVNCRCVLDVNQDDSAGFTSRFLEAVMYNKPLIADNSYIKQSKYYNPEFIQVYDNWNDLDPEFVKKDGHRVDYHYEGDFSPIRLIEKIDKELVRRFGE